MLRNLSISTKVAVVLTPLFLLSFVVVIYVNYRSEEQQLLEQAQSAALAQSNTIKRTLVHLMTKYEEVDDKLLTQISQPGGDVQNLQVLFHLDSLKLGEDFLTPARVEKLRQRQERIQPYHSNLSARAFATGQPVWAVTCAIPEHHGTKHRHDPVVLASLDMGLPWEYWDCGTLRIILPFPAERRCQTCHDVANGSVLGAASMDIPFHSTTSAIRSNALRSAGIVLAFSAVVFVIGGITFRRYVGRPIQQLVRATTLIGERGLDESITGSYDNDEIGRLAESFRRAQQRLREAQEELVRRERLSTLGQMASGIIHDFRNPMTNISVSLQVIERQPDMPGERRATLFRHIRESLDRMVRMTHELLEYARGETRLEMEQVACDEFLRDVEAYARPHLEAHRIELGVRCADDAPSALFDRERLMRCVLNLVNNAQDAMPDGGRISIEIRRVGSAVEIEVSDTGPGIPPSIRSTLFEPFVTYGKPKGTGLGLAITRRVVEQHGGSIRFACGEAGGTTFTISIPNGAAQQAA
jgi:signal transduction histidine kinase